MREALIDYLLDNREYFQEKYKSLIDKKKKLKQNESVFFHSDIDSEFIRSIIQSMSVELCKATGADMETVMIVLEEMNAEEFFNDHA